VQDGAGAQILRILAIESLACFLNTGFSHHNILDIDSNYGDGLNDLTSKSDFVEELNHYLDFKKYSCQHSKHIIKRLSPIQKRSYFFMFTLYLYRFVLSKSKNNYLLLVDNPYPGILKRAKIYHSVRLRHQFTAKTITQTLSIKIHLPWAGVGAGQLLDRQISLEWYKELLLKLNDYLLAAGFRCNFTFHTDGIQGLKRDLLSLGVSEKTKDYWRLNGLLSNKKMNWSYIDIKSEFDALPNVEVIYGITPIKVWNDMADGDILVLAKSSLSNVGGLLNINALKIIPPTVFGLPEDFNPISIEELKSPGNLEKILAFHFNF
jgi:hypothetical protein